MSILKRHNVRDSGAGRPIVFAHGYGCDQNVWRSLTPAFSDDHRIVLFDYAGCGGSDPRAYDFDRHATLHGHADDLISVCDALSLQRAVLVAHSVSTMIGVLAADRRPDLFDALVLLAPSPSYIDVEGYEGGFARRDIEDLLEMLRTNHFGWARMMAPVIMANADRPALSLELEGNFCRMEPRIAAHFGRVTFLADHRSDLRGVKVPSLILQCEDDALAAPHVGDYLHEHLSGSRLMRLAATGHCPHMSAPQETAAAIRRYIATRPAGTPTAPQPSTA